MPKKERPAYTISDKPIIINEGKSYQSEKYELLGRASVFGKTLRKYFTTKTAAEEFAENRLNELRAHGKQARELTDVQRSEAVQAFDLLKGQTDLLTAVRFYVTHTPDTRKVTVATAAEGFLASLGISTWGLKNPLKWRPVEERAKDSGDYSNRHRLTQMCNMRQFIKVFGKKPVHAASVSQLEIREYLTSRYKNPRTQRNKRATLHSFFVWCIEQKYCVLNPAKTWKAQQERLRKYGKGRKPGIVTPLQLRDLLQAAEKHDPEMLPYILIGAFSGVRPEELQELSWENIRSKIIHLPAQITKTDDARDIPIHPTLAKWLTTIPRGQGLIAPNDAIHRRLTLWRFNYCEDPNNPTKDELDRCPKWPHDALRHSFGSYRYAEIESIDQVSTEMRHEDSRVFKKHYLNRGVTKEDAKAYWGLKPSPKLASKRGSGK